MSYYFAGFFVDCVDSRLNEEAKARWSLLDVRRISSPFVGYGFSFPDHNCALEIADGDAAIQQSMTAEEALPQFSIDFPGATFLWVEADCFGSVCQFTGYGCRNGQVLLEVKDPSPGDHGCREDLRRLVRVLGVELDESAYFLPFTRGFFRFQRGYFRLS